MIPSCRASSCPATDHRVRIERPPDQYDRYHRRGHNRDLDRHPAVSWGHATGDEGVRRLSPLTGLKVLDISTVYAAPITAMLLGDMGADVLKVEHPNGDPARTHGWDRDGHGLWWKVIARNKRAVTLNLSTPEGQELLRELAADADVLVENFRPGVLEKWGLGPDVLLQRNPRLVMLRVTGFGQDGPYAERRAFGTLMEAMSGFAHQTGQEDGPPTLPPFGLADGVAGIAGAYAVLTALYHRDARRRRGPGDRPRPAGAAAGHPRARPDRVRPARHRRRTARQPLAQQRPAQRLRHPRRPLGRHLGQRHLDRRTGDAPGRAARPRREAVVRLGRGAQPPRRGARRRRAEVDRRPRPRRRARRVRGRRGGLARRSTTSSSS